jgi:hypothetical protein
MSRRANLLDDPMLIAKAFTKCQIAFANTALRTNEVAITKHHGDTSIPSMCPERSPLQPVKRGTFSANGWKHLTANNRDSTKVKANAQSPDCRREGFAACCCCLLLHCWGCPVWVHIYLLAAALLGMSRVGPGMSTALLHCWGCPVWILVGYIFFVFGPCGLRPTRRKKKTPRPFPLH